MSPLKQLRKLITAPPHKTAAKVFTRAKHAVENAVRRRFDLRTNTYSAHIAPSNENQTFSPLLKGFDVEKLHESVDQTELDSLIALCGRYLNHEFDLLGSGWVQVQHGMTCKGLNGIRYDHGSQVNCDKNGDWLQSRVQPANRKRSQAIWKLVDADYIPIDWQRDFKSGYRWDETCWFRDIPLGHLPGVDIKVPWELARMQHLPQLALAFNFLDISPENETLRLQLCSEFRNQILEFLATNPPRFGVNWQCAMDVGIRVANWLLAYDLFRAGGAKFDSEFEQEFLAAVFDHGAHIISNLEWNRELRGNHYLADIAGLLFVAVSLPCSDITNAWLAFAVRQLIVEVDQQFLTDGGNFEASTCYHRLSMEMAVWCTAVVLGLNDENQAALADYHHKFVQTTPALEPAPVPMFDGSPFPGWYFDRLNRMTDFAMHVTKPNGIIHQLGDNDSGKFINLLPAMLTSETTDLQENHLDTRAIIAAANGILQRTDLQDNFGTNRVEAHVVQCLIGNDYLLPSCGIETITETQRASRPEAGSVNFWLKKLDSTPGLSQTLTTITLPKEVSLADCDRHAYPEFGLFICRNSRCYFAVRCGPLGQNGIGGHAHNDQLAIELQVDGIDWIADPGSYLYTPDAASRNVYRSVTSHFVPRANELREPGRLDGGLFRINNCENGTCLYVGADGFVGRHFGNGIAVTRVIQVNGEQILIHDFADNNLELAQLSDLAEGQYFKPGVAFSFGYGIR